MPQKTQNIALKAPDSPKTSNIAEVKKFPLKAADSQIKSQLSKFTHYVKFHRFAKEPHRPRSSKHCVKDDRFSNKPTAVEAYNPALKTTDSPKKPTAVEVKKFPLKTTDSQINSQLSKFKPRVKSARFTKETNSCRSQKIPFKNDRFSNKITALEV